MIKYFKILNLIFLISFAFSDVLAPDISFIDLPLNAKHASLGNTYLSDIGSPTNILLNPANIWFGDDINKNKNSFIKNTYSRANISNLQFMEKDNIFNLMHSIQFGKAITLGLGYTESSQNDIEHYDSNANYLGDIEYKQSATSIGFASKFSGINIGFSATQFYNNFINSNTNDSLNENELQLLTTGLSINNIHLKSNKSNDLGFLGKFIYLTIPNKISIHMSSRILYYEGISNNSLSKNIYGIKALYTPDKPGAKSSIYFLYDFLSNNDVSDNIVNIGTGYQFQGSSITMGINLGVNDFNSNNNITYGLEFIMHSAYDISVGLSKTETSWNSDLTILSFKISRKYKN